MYCRVNKMVRFSRTFNGFGLLKDTTQISEGSNQCLESGSESVGSARCWHPDPQKYADPRIRIQGAKYQQKLHEKPFLFSKPISELLKKRAIIKMS